MIGKTDRRTLDALHIAKDLITAPENWSKGAYARDANDVSVEPHSDDAVKFCPKGALYSIRSDYTYGYVCRAGMYLHEALPPCDEKPYAHVMDFNDRAETCHADIIALFDSAIVAVHVDLANYADENLS